MNKLIFGGIGLAFIVCIFLVVNFGLRPRPIKVIKASDVNGPEEVGNVLFKRLYPEIKRRRVVILGERDDAGFSSEMISAFLANYEKVLSQQVTLFELNNEVGIKAFMKEAPSDSKLVILAPNQALKHLPQKSDYKYLFEGTSWMPVLIAQTDFVLDVPKLNELEKTCESKGVIFDTQEKMLCEGVLVAKTALRRPRDLNKTWIAMNQLNSWFHVLFVYQPEAKKVP